MPVTLANPKQSVTLDKARIMRIEIENNVCKHSSFENHKYVDVYVVLGREIEGENPEDPPIFVEQMDPEKHSIAKIYRITDGYNPHAREALPGADPRSDGNPLGKCDNEECGVWQDRGIGSVCPDCEVGTIQPYDGFTRSGASWPPKLLDFMQAAVAAFAQQSGAQDAFAEGGEALSTALGSFMVSPQFFGIVMQNEMYLYKIISQGIYEFLQSEVVPEPIEGIEKPLLEVASE